MAGNNYELIAKGDGTYRLIIHGAIKFEGLTFSEAVDRICEAENEAKPRKNKEDKTHV